MIPVHAKWADHPHNELEKSMNINSGIGSVHVQNAV